MGKTTVALNLACILAKKEPVLLLDCDITGTSIVDPVKNSSFWNDETNVLTYVDKNGEMKDLNLIQFFLERFIKGEGNARDIIKQEKLMTGKVNVRGSFLYVLWTACVNLWNPKLVPVPWIQDVSPQSMSIVCGVEL